ncbi:histidine phosphatase family protein [Nocardioides sp. SOB77]|uniref:Histidine phosphatase family protein n=1 Tax=Nocardioides oceani TaxID=3058369 RepID=A0ABT8FKH8_9ACTN|nr:histidine phosphatase family protein [Nocardioides oceani]MDN4174960.1 histidine phosphatase family protein [Nocardioides oceani]
MSELWLVRHGQTEWSRDHRHTSVSDLPLLPEGEEVARTLRERLAPGDFEVVRTSPRQRARRTAELAGFPDAEVDEDLVEWAYGEYEGITTDEIRETVPGWTVWNHPSPGGETAEEVTTRLDRVVERARAVEGRTLVFAHGHCLRALAARWLGLPVAGGRHLKLGTATVSVLAWERETPVVERWNA